MLRGLALAAVVLLVCAVPAGAAEKPATCATLQSVLDGAQDGDVITLDSSASPGGLCNTQYTLKSFPSPSMPTDNYVTWTLKGRDGMNDGFDGTGLPGRLLTGHDSHRVLIQDLTFRDSSALGTGESGGAIGLTGETGVQIFLSDFFNNHADNRGGAVHLTQEPGAIGHTLPVVSLLGNTFGSATNAAEGNSAEIGGAVSIETPGQGQNSSFNGNTFANNTATWDGGGFDFELAPGGTENFSLSENVVIDNTAGGSGAGGHVIVANTIFRADNELYRGNSIETQSGGPQDADHFGAGLAVRGDGGPMVLRNNVFRSNTLNAVADGEDYGGGGLAVIGDALDVESEFSRFEGNTVAGQPDAAFESEGGGIYFSGQGSTWYGFLDAIAGNSLGARGEGGGMYVGAVATGTTLELGEVTVAHNTVGAGGQGAGLAGSGDDVLIARNSLLWNEPNHTGFASLDVSYSLMCAPGGGPVPGEGNICADPKLVGGTDIHQTKESPTIDKGNDAYFQDEGGGERNETDYEGDPRPTDGDSDGHTIDMGADETPAGFITQTQPPPQPTQPAALPPQCSDLVDNDGDGAVDRADPGCLSGPTDDNEGDETERDLVLCGERTISLVRADLSRGRVVLSGVVAASVAGRKVELSVRYPGRRRGSQKLGSVTPGADGRFQARVRKPPRSLVNVARYRAQVGSARSVELKLPQSLASTSLRQAGGGMLELRGQVQRSVLGRRNAVVVKRILCGRYATVGQARPNRRGVYVVRFPAPAASAGGAALYRAETRVLARPGTKRYVKQFARAIAITF